MFSLSDFLRRRAALPQKITFLKRPVGAFEIVAPTLERTRIVIRLAFFL